MVHSEAIFCFFGGISFTIEGIKVLGSDNRFWKNLSVALSDDSIALWTATLW